MAFIVSRESDSIHKKFGTLTDKPKEKPQEEPMNEVLSAVDQKAPRKGLSYDHLKEDLEDQIFDTYRRDCLNEMIESARKPKFGEVIEISKEDFTTEVSQAPKDTFVIVHLYQEHIVHCKLIDECLKTLARKYINHKFVKIQATMCIENFRDSDCPAILVYRNSEIEHQLIACACLFGGANISANTIEWVLAKLNVWETDLEENPINKKFKIIKEIRNDEDENSSDDERQYFSRRRKTWRF